jgi:hypothetical protein
MRVAVVFQPDEPVSGEQFLVTVEDGDEPAVDLEVELDRNEGVMTCTAVTVREKEGVTSRDVRVPVERFLDLAARHPGLFIQGAPAGRRRRNITDAFLRDVVATYVAGGRSVDAVRAVPRFSASPSQVFRWLKTARERGILTDPKES